MCACMCVRACVCGNLHCMNEIVIVSTLMMMMMWGFMSSDVGLTVDFNLYL